MVRGRGAGWRLAVAGVSLLAMGRDAAAQERAATTEAAAKPSAPRLWDRITIVPGSAGSPASAAGIPSAQVTVSILPGPLEPALDALAKQVGLKLAYETSLTEGLTTRGAKGRLQPLDALDRVLEGTGLTYRTAGASTITLVNPRYVQLPAPDTAVLLDELMVESTVVRPVSRPSEPISGRGGPSLPGGFLASRPSSGILGNRSVLDTPFSIEGFTEKIIRDQQALVATDVLKNDPSVTIQNTIGYYTDAFLIRGFAPGISNILYDGMTVGILGKFQLEGIERLDLIKGPAAVLFGVGAFQGVGGVLNYAPKRPLPFDYTSVGTAVIQPGYSVTTLDMSRTSADGTWGARFNGAFGRGTFWSDTFLQHDVAQLTLAGRPSDSVRIFADFVYWTNLNSRDQLPFNLANGVAVPRAPSPKVNYGQKWNFTDNPGLLAVVRTEIDLSNDWTLNLGWRSTGYGNNYIATVPTITNNAGAYTINALQTIPTTYFDVGGQASFNGRVLTGPIKHDISIGTDIQHDEAGGGANASLGNFASNIYRPVYYPQPSLIPKPTYRLIDSLATTAFISDFVSLPGDTVQVLGALRWIDINYASFNRVNNFGLFKTDQDKFVPVGAVLVHPTPWSTLYASYAQGFERGGTAPATALNAGAVLPPVSSEQIEVGAKAIIDGVTATFAAFHINRALEYIDTATLRFVQNGRQIHDGLEFALSGEPIEGFRILGGVTVIDPIAKNTGSLLTEGRLPIGVPRFQLSGYAELDLPWLLRGLTVTGGLYYVGREFYDLTNQRSVTPGTRIDLGLRYDTVWSGYRATVRLGVENVADRYYWAAATTSGLGLAAPRTIKASVQLRW